MEGLILLMTNLDQIYLDNEALHPMINDFIKNIFMGFFYRKKDNQEIWYIEVDEKYTTWRVSGSNKDKVELEFKMLLKRPELNDNHPLYVVSPFIAFMKIYVNNEDYDIFYKIQKEKDSLRENDTPLVYSMYQELLCAMISQKTSLDIRIKYPPKLFDSYGIKNFQNGEIYNDFFENSLHYFKLIDENVIGYVQIDIEGDKIISTNIIELKKINSSFYYPSEINLFFDKDYENAETLFLYYCALLRIFYKIEIDAIELRGNFSQMITEIEKTIILLKY